MDTNLATTKTISKGTLGLRFMQNALRAKQLKEVEIEKAEVQDDGQWEVDQKVRAAWGPAPSPSSQTISYETSYLPFIFSSDASGSSSEADLQKPKGRRVFNKHGIEETALEKEAHPTPVSTTVPDQKRLKIHARPKAISGGSVNLFGFPDQASSKSKNARTVKQLIHDNTGVGEDLHPHPSRKLPDLKTKPELTSVSTPSKSIFLKPAGVDDPHETHVTGADSDIIHGARNQKKSKRERPSAGHPDGEEDTKRKKKKKVQKSTI